MARVPIAAGNWKMNTTRESAGQLAADVAKHAAKAPGVEVIVCPPFLYLFDVRDATAGSTVRVGAQNCFWEEKGAFTGEVSVTQVAEAADYVIIGHSERRQYFGETDETVNRRVRAALAHGLKPIVCVGETLSERNGGETEAVLLRQVREGLAEVTIPRYLVVAYEPVWAIGTGLAADGAMAQAAIGLIRDTLRERCGDVADDVRILYGGSVTPENAAEFMTQPDIDGGLVGGASLKADSFAAIIDAMAAAVSAGA
ncbi:MAG TPA: triose-phosphate isomerase [Dehalococcoidia bacterium]|nr:triose-phosphate isomerase [Dehalococcoidia bacterium]